MNDQEHFRGVVKALEVSQRVEELNLKINHAQELHSQSLSPVFCLRSVGLITVVSTRYIKRSLDRGTSLFLDRETTCLLLIPPRLDQQSTHDMEVIIIALIAVEVVLVRWSVSSPLWMILNRFGLG